MVWAHRLAPLSLLAVLSCHRVTRPVMKSKIGMEDIATASQLIDGFYGLEANSWRWTSRRFSVILPGPTKPRSSTLTVQLFIPDSQIATLGKVTLNASINGLPLEPQTYQSSGSYTFQRKVAASELESNLIPIHFSISEYPQAGIQEPIERGIVVSQIALQAN